MAKSKKLVDDVLRMDQLLYKKAVEIFDERMQRMKDLKAKGMECSLYNSKCGISCESNGHT